MTKTKAMLAHKYNPNKANYPAYIQPKLDGVRCLFTAEGAFSRAGNQFMNVEHIEHDLKPVFNKYPNLILDGELYNHGLKNDFEKNSGKSIVDFFREYKINPLHMKAALLPSHGPVVWGESIEDAVENAVVLEHIAKLAYRTGILNDWPDMDSNLIKKHFFRKHGGESYYGQ